MKLLKLASIIILISATMACETKKKEVELILKAQSSYPMEVHYQFSHNKKVYAQGNISFVVNDKTVHHIYVNEIPVYEAILIQIDKMNVANQTVFGDPCRIELSKEDLTGKITIGFKGDPATHGNFTCHVSKTKNYINNSK